MLLRKALSPSLRKLLVKVSGGPPGWRGRPRPAAIWGRRCPCSSFWSCFCSCSCSCSLSYSISCFQLLLQPLILLLLLPLPLLFLSLPLSLLLLFLLLPLLLLPHTTWTSRCSLPSLSRRHTLGPAPAPAPAPVPSRHCRLAGGTWLE